MRAGSQAFCAVAGVVEEGRMGRERDVQGLMASQTRKRRGTSLVRFYHMRGLSSLVFGEGEGGGGAMTHKQRGRMRSSAVLRDFIHIGSVHMCLGTSQPPRRWMSPVMFWERSPPWTLQMRQPSLPSPTPASRKHAMRWALVSQRFLCCRSPYHGGCAWQ